MECLIKKEKAEVEKKISELQDEILKQQNKGTHLKGNNIKNYGTISKRKK